MIFKIFRNAPFLTDQTRFSTDFSDSSKFFDKSRLLQKWFGWTSDKLVQIISRFGNFSLSKTSSNPRDRTTPTGSRSKTLLSTVHLLMSRTSSAIGVLATWRKLPIESPRASWTKKPTVTHQQIYFFNLSNNIISNNAFQIKPTYKFNYNISISY